MAQRVSTKQNMILILILIINHKLIYNNHTDNHAVKSKCGSVPELDITIILESTNDTVIFLL